jgi:hypothetical protein
VRQADGGVGGGGPFAGPRTPWSWRADGVVAGILAVATVLLRWPRMSRTPYTVDSVLFALATERYDLMSLRPHPPGYPLFVALGKALLPFADGDPNRAFVLQAMLWSGVAVALLYGLVRCWGSRRAALATAALFAVAPAFAFNGVIALSYTAEAASTVGVALLAWHAWTRPSRARLLALGAAWALAVGIRQSSFLFLAPLVALALWGRDSRLPADWRPLATRTLAAGGAALFTALAWFLPMAWASGGVAEVRRATALQSSQVVFADAVWVRGRVAFTEHAERLTFYLHWDAAVFLPMMAVLALAGVAVHKRRDAPQAAPAWPAGAGLFMAVWLAPCLLFYLLVFDGWDRGPIGYVLTLLPGVYALAVLLADHGLRRLEAAQLPRLRPAVGAAAVLLLLLPAPNLHRQADDLIAFEAGNHDEWARRWQQLETEYPANSTAILTWQSWAHVKWSFPDHLAWTYFPTYKVEGKTDWALVFAMRHHEDEAPFIPMVMAGPGSRPEHPLPADIDTIVVFDFQLAGEGGETRRLDPALDVTEAFLADGWRILLLHPDDAHPTVESLFTAEALGDGARAARLD